jgi:hypothetical protein
MNYLVVPQYADFFNRIDPLLSVTWVAASMVETRIAVIIRS